MLLRRCGSMSATPTVTVSLNGLGTIVEASPVPLYFQLIKLVEERIRANDWLPGESLPSEQAFCDHFGLSRTVVRQAFADLEQRGLLKKRNGKKTTVSHPEYRGALMQSLVGFHEEAERRGQNPRTKVLEFKTIPADAKVANKLCIAEGSKVILLTRLRFLGDEPEVYVKTYLHHDHCVSLLSEDFSDKSLYGVLEQRLGLVIAKGVRTIRAVALNAKEASMLKTKPQSPALLLSSIGFLPDGTVLEYFVAKHRGDRTEFEVQLIR
jgi:GntR family transcriptional regulator